MFINSKMILKVRLLRASTSKQNKNKEATGSGRRVVNLTIMANQSGENNNFAEQSDT